MLFISYKHAELDNKVAEEIQNGLERFRIPKRSGKRPERKRSSASFEINQSMKRVNMIEACAGYSVEAGKYVILNHCNDTIYTDIILSGIIRLMNR